MMMRRSDLADALDLAIRNLQHMEHVTGFPPSPGRAAQRDRWIVAREAIRDGLPVVIAPDPSGPPAPPDTTTPA